MEEVSVSYDTSLLGSSIPMRISYIDLVYQKPVLIKNTTGAVNQYDLYHPKFAIQGVQVELSNIGLPFLEDWNIDLGYGSSTSGKMYLGNLTTDNPLNTENTVTMQRINVGLEWEMWDSLYLTYRGEYMWIDLKGDSQDQTTISLDAINHASFLWKF